MEVKNIGRDNGTGFLTDFVRRFGIIEFIDISNNRPALFVELGRVGYRKYTKLDLWSDY